METCYHDRRSAGQFLAKQLDRYDIGHDALILGLPRGGVPVAYEVAEHFRAELDVLVVRKLGHPKWPELALGAIASGGVQILNEPLMHSLGLTGDDLTRVIAAERDELARRELAYRGERPPPIVAKRTVVLVDDGLATGASMRAAVMAVRQSTGHAVERTTAKRSGSIAQRVIVAIPVGSQEACAWLKQYADAVVCPLVPSDFSSVGQWYEDFSQTTDDEVRDLLRRASKGGQAGEKSITANKP